MSSSHVLQTLSNNIANQENVTSRLMGKNATTNNNKLKPVSRTALNDLGNRIHTLQHDNKGGKAKDMGPPVAVPRKKIEVVKKRPVLSTLSKENVSKKENSRENSLISGNKPSAKPIRQDSIIFSKSAALQIQKKTTEVVKTTEVAKKPTTEQTKDSTIYDPDENTRNDPHMVTEYVEDILAYLRSIEDDFPIREKFLENSKVTPKMRATLVNWLVDAHGNFNLGLEVLYLTISIIDRYLQANKAVDRSIFQLVGASALLLASKYEEVFVPDISDFVYICDNAFTKRQILQMEIDIVKRLQFRMGWPIAVYFLRRYSKIAHVRSDQHALAKYILELALLEYGMAHFKPSIQAAAACCLALAVMNESLEPSRVWSPTLVHYTTYKYSDFKTVLVEFAHMIVRAETSKFDTVRVKYAASKYGKISSNFKLQGPLIRRLTSPIVSRK